MHMYVSVLYFNVQVCTYTHCSWMDVLRVFLHQVRYALDHECMINRIVKKKLKQP